MEEHQRSPLDDWTRYGVRLPMFLGGGILISSAVAVTLSLTAHVNSAAIPVGISLACVGIWLIVDAFFKIDHIKGEEAEKHFRSKLIQIQWEEEVKKDSELLVLATNIPDEDIEPDFNILMQAVKQQCAISLVNQELIKEGKQPVPDVTLPDNFPKHNPRRKSDYITFSNTENYIPLTKKYFRGLNASAFPSLPNIYSDVNLKGETFCKDSDDYQFRLSGNMQVQDKEGLYDDIIELPKIPNSEYKSKITLSKSSRKSNILRKNDSCQTTFSKLSSNLITNIYQSLSTSDIYKNIPKIDKSFDRMQSLHALNNSGRNLKKNSSEMTRYGNETLKDKITLKSADSFDVAEALL